MLKVQAVRENAPRVTCFSSNILGSLSFSCSLACNQTEHVTLKFDVVHA